MKKIILFYIICILFLNACSNSESTKEEIKICTDKCVTDICDGTIYFSCQNSIDGCKYNYKEGIIIGKCGVECIKDTDCQQGFECEENKCKEDIDRCPILSTINVFEWKNIMGDTYFRLNSSYNKEILDSYNISWSFYVQCEKGSEEGENINYWYCGKRPDFWGDHIHLEKKIIDDQGNILEVIDKEAYNVYDENLNFIETVCDE